MGDNISFQEVLAEIPNYIIYHKNVSRISKLELIMLSNGLFPRRFKYLKPFFDTATEYYGHDHLFLSPLFYARKLNLIEDGIKNYQPPVKRNIFKRCVLSLLRVPVSNMGYCDYVSKIYLTGLSDTPLDIISKVSLVNRNDFISNLDVMLNSVFKIKTIMVKNVTLLITQPLSEDGVLTEKEKIDIYSRIISKFENVIIKPHPRELTNYQVNFPKCSVLNNYNLVESVMYDNKLKNVVTLFSTAIYDFEEQTDANVIYYGTAVHDNLIRAFGYIEGNSKI
ncbi:glycosyltransferase family 52 [Aliivibrio salmonicida]|nr:glycosyltransferase family 52 [Aliivibrio salmonicida]